MKKLLSLFSLMLLVSCGNLGLDKIGAVDFRATQSRQNVNVDYHDCSKESMRYIRTEPGVTYTYNPFKGFIINCMQARGYIYR